jgi:hypothetical protein
MRARYEGGRVCGSVRYLCTAEPAHTFYVTARTVRRKRGGHSQLSFSRLQTR